MSALIFALINAVCFGLNPIVLSKGFQKSGSDGDAGVFVGLVTGLPLLLAMVPLEGGMQWSHLSWPVIGYFGVGALSGLVLGRTFLYMGIVRLGATRAIVVKNGAPLVSALLAAAVLHEKVSTIRWLAIGAIIVGVTLVGKKSKGLPGTHPLSGLLLAGLSALCYGIRPVLLKLGLSELALPVTATTIGYLVAIIIYLAYYLSTGHYRMLKFERSAIGMFAAAGILQTVGLLSLTYALTTADVSMAYPITATAPLMTFFLSYAVLKNIEKLTAWDFSGTMAVVAGVILLAR